MIITIDGPSGSGKSTVAGKLAKKLGFIHVNQGAFYRAVGLKAAQQGVALDDDELISQLARETTFSFAPLAADAAEPRTGISEEGDAALLVDGHDLGE